ncbi:MAG TPA: hypothetical protein VHV30_16605 [Polyangiaceae bacterium]|jgi:hypothetical protein|nr:hypothetical protein [Polyangiaceae bacterium]
MIRRVAGLPTIAVAVVVMTMLAGCDKSGPLADLDASWTVSPSPQPSDSVSAATAPARDAGRVMPPRPVPTTSPTVKVTMPIEVQLQAIQYMAAMEAPQPDDAPPDPAYAQTIATGLASVGKTEVISSGRRIDITMAKGCDATLPRQAVARHTGALLTTLLSHGIIVIRCADHELQCLQSTRDADDVLCTHK